MKESKNPILLHRKYSYNRGISVRDSHRATNQNTLPQSSTKPGVFFVSRVPFDILREIFEAYHGIGSPVRLPTCRSCPTGPFTFSHVCRDWQEAALGATNIWSSLHIEIAQSLGPVQAKKISNFIDTCARYSGRRPLHYRLSINSHIAKGKLESDLLNPISLHTVWHVILSRQERWREIYVEATRAALEELFAYDHITPARPTPLLRIFSLRGEYEFRDRTHFLPESAAFFDGVSAPLLRTLSLYGNALSWANRQTFPWRQLNQLNLGSAHLGLTFEECVEILRGCESLLCCRISISRRRIREHIRPINPVVLASLEDLEIIDHNLPAQEGDIYHTLQCPKLTDITIRYLEGDDCDDGSLLWANIALSVFLRHSSRIRGLHLWHAPLTERGLIGVLEEHITITHLTIINGRFDTMFGNRALSKLTVDPSHAMLLKKLVYISIASRRCSGFFIEKFVESRRGAYYDSGITNLEHLRFNSLGVVMEPSLQSRLKISREEGLVLKIVCDSSF